jgi:hypothetical protein
MSTSKTKIQMNYAEIIKTDLLRMAKERGLAVTTKTTKPAIVELLELDDATKPTTKKVSKRGPSTKDALRAMFEQTGTSIPVEDVLAALSHVKPDTVVTMLGDLKNKRYAAGPVIIVERQEGQFVRTA